MIGLRNHHQLRVGLAAMQPVGVGDGHLQILAALQDQHWLPHRADRRWRVECRQRLHEVPVYRNEQHRQHGRHIRRRLAAEILRHRSVVADQRGAIELARQLLSHHHPERPTQSRHTDDAAHGRPRAGCNQRERRALAVPEQHHAREPGIAR